ncbi:MAG: FAD-dependent oxidoreductase [Caldisericota bacterium]|nr:FAD-dependent oxidoreductase [Caldisericota bacterium]
MKERMVDLLIVGAGPAGMAAALYAGRSLLKPVVLERMSIGGLAGTADWIDNYPGFAEGVAAYDLMESMHRQAERFGAEFVLDEALTLTRTDAGFDVATAEQTVFHARAVIVASGAVPRALPLKEEAKYRGHGVSYCATCDAAFFLGKQVAVVGGGDAAVNETLVLAKGSSRVFLVHPLETLQATQVLVEQVSGQTNVELVAAATPTGLRGEGKLEALIVRQASGGDRTLAVEGVFVAMEYTPVSNLLQGLVEVDAQGYVVLPETTESGVPGLYVAGDVRRKVLKQIVTAVADGAVAAQRAAGFLRRAAGKPEGSAPA